MKPIFSVEVFGILVPDTVFVTLGLTVLITLVLAISSRHMQVKGLSRWQTAIEVYVGWISNTLSEIFDEDSARYAPLIATLIAFIAVSNLLSIIPVIRPPTAELSTTVALALIVFFAVPYYGIRKLGFSGYLRKYVEPHPLLLPFNLIGEVTRTLALAVRLFGNIMSGQMIGAIALVVAGALVPIPLMMLGILTGLVQAYIFGILAAVYIAAAVDVGERTTRSLDPPLGGARGLKEPSHG